jgi:hypothetical protein
MAIRDIEAARKSYEEVFTEIIEQIPPELRVRGLTPEQRVVGLTPEQRVVGLTPEQLAELLMSDRVLDALPPEAREQIEKKLRH